MELWIKSQDGRCILKANRFDYDRAGGDHYIVVNGFHTVVGKYKTEERALKVLDEIRDLIRAKYTFETDFKTAANTLPLEEAIKVLEQITVYEMPKE